MSAKLHPATTLTATPSAPTGWPFVTRFLQPVVVRAVRSATGLLPAIALLLILSGCKGSQDTAAPASDAATTGTATAAAIAARHPNTFIYASDEDPKHLDPIYRTDIYEGQIDALIYDNLVHFNTGDKVELRPGLAESWDISEDGKTYTFHLRKGVQALDDRGQHGAAYDCARHIGEALGERLAARGLERNEADGALRHGPAVADEEVQQEQHRRERQHGADRTQERRAPERRQALEQLAPALQHPGLHFRGADLCMGVQPFEHRTDHRQPGEIGKTPALLADDPLLQQSRKLGRLARESDRERGQRADEQQQHENRQQESRDRFPSAQRAGQACQRRLQQEPQEHGPGQRREERLEDPVQEDREQPEAGNCQHALVEQGVSDTAEDDE